jgi:adenylate kinase family enzyme
MRNNSAMKIGYVPVGDDIDRSPGDYRRFCSYADIRGINYEVADFNKAYDIVIVTQGADITLWKNYNYGIVIYDFIDSYLSLPKTDLRAIFRGLAKYIVGQHKVLEFNYWKSVQDMCARSDIVINATEEQMNYVYPYCKNSRIILDYHYDTIKDTKSDYKIGDKVKIVWEGMPSNIYQLKIIKNVLSRLSNKYNIELNIVTKPIYFKFINKWVLIHTKKEVEKFFKNSNIYEWRKDTISRIVCQNDIAIVPIDSKYLLNKHKPENKILFFWKVGIPVVASDIPSYSRVEKNSNVDFTCKNEEDWYRKIERLIISSSLREDMARTGKEYANKVSNTKAITKQWDNMFSLIGVNFN